MEFMGVPFEVFEVSELCSEWCRKFFLVKQA
jgi:hypothetical protein